MARPKKDGLSYFPLDVDFFEDPKVKILRARYGRDGIVFYIYLLCKIYKQGYYIQVDDDFEYIISDDLKMDQNKAKQVLNFLLSRSLFDNTLFQSDKVLTSAGIQRRFQLAVKERARKNPIEVGRFWLLKKEETEPFIKCTLFTGSSWKPEGFSWKNESNSPEESLKKSKVNKNIYNTCAPKPHDEEQLRKDFETIYGIYPKKRGRTNAFINYKAWVGKGKDVGGKKYRLTNRQIYKAVQKYVRQQEEAGQDDYQYWKNFDTLMGRQLLDYVEWEDS